MFPQAQVIIIGSGTVLRRLRAVVGNPFPMTRRRHRLGKSPVPRKGPRSTPPGPVGACIRKMRVQRQLVPSRTSAGLGEQKANQVVCGVARKLRLPSLVLIPVALALADHE
jgi:hypothetical protein